MVTVNLVSVDEFVSLLLAVELLLVVEVMLLLLGVDELLSVVGELVVEL